MSGVWGEKAKGGPAKPLLKVEIPPSTNLQSPEVPQSPQTPVEPPKQEGRGQGRKMTAGALARPARSVADRVDGRVLNSTGRVRPLQLTVDDQVNDDFREEAARRKDERLEGGSLSELFEMCWAAFKREQGIA